MYIKPHNNSNTWKRKGEGTSQKMMHGNLRADRVRKWSPSLVIRESHMQMYCDSTSLIRVQSSRQTTTNSAGKGERTVIYCWNYKLVQPLWRPLKRWKIELLYDPDTPFLKTHSEASKSALSEREPANPCLLQCYTQ